MLAKIGDRDITKNIITDSYEVNAEDVYNEWTDANKRRHRDVIRQRVVGTFTLKFNTEEEHADFVSLLKANKALDHTLPMTLYVVNNNEEKQTNVYYSLKPGVYKSRAEGKTYKSFSFGVEEP